MLLVICKLHARVLGTCAHTPSLLSRSSQFLFEATEALRSSGVDSMAHRSGLSSSFLGALCGLHGAVFFTYIILFGPHDSHVITPIFQKKTAGHREGEWLAQVCTAVQWFVDVSII